MSFYFKKLDVYKLSVDFAVEAKRIADELPKGNANLRDQLTRASSSIVLNIAEGWGKPHKDDKKRYYASSHGSAAECSACLELILKTGGASEEVVAKCDEMLNRIGAMLIKLIESIAAREK